MNESKTFTLDEIAALAELPRRTVRYYIQSGLIDRPQGVGKGAYYTSDEDGEFRRLRHFDLASGTRRVVREDISWDVESLAMSRDRSLLAFTVNADGTIVLHGRGSVCINTAGEKVYPEEVEEVLKTHPAVADALVVGVPDAKSGEAVKAYIQLKAGETATAEEIMAFCKDNMAGYKRPKHIEFRDTLPMSNVGKVLRRVLRDEEHRQAK